MEENGFVLKGVTLREYQKQNVDFALMKKNSICSLAIGMGKTLASIAVFLEVKKNNIYSKCLVICPSSLKYHWAEEIKNYTNLKFLISDGNFNKRQKIYNDFLKNIKSQQHRGVVKLKSDFKIGLTGMPLENSPQDIFGIMRFINPMVFPQLTTFKNDYFVS